MLGIFDSHAHYDDRQFDSDRDELLKGMADRGVEFILNAGSDIKSTQKTIKLTEEYPFVYGSAGVHPEECGSMDEQDIDIIRNAATHEKIVAIGEIGLDYHWPEPEHEVQIKWFKKQLELACSLHMPVIIHSRDAAWETMNILKEYSDSLPDGRCGVVHCFSGSPEMAQEYVKMGYYIGVGGVVTFNNAKKLKEVVKVIPIERIVIETDCPYMAPVPFRGKRNDSGYLKYVISAISEIKGMPAEEVIRATRSNAMELYGIKE